MNVMKKPFRNMENRWQIALVVLSLLFAIMAAVSILVFQSTYTPLFLLLGTIAILSLLFWLKKPVWALLFLLFFILLPTSLIPGQINSYLNRSMTVIALTVWVLDTIRRRSRIHIPISTVLMLLFIAWASISLLWAENIAVGVTTLQRYILRLIVFFLLVVNEIKTSKNLNGLMNILVLSGFLLVIVSSITVFRLGYESGTRLQVLDENANGLGISLLVTLPAVLWWASRTNNHNSTLKKMLAVIFLIATIGFIGLSGSRGSAISLGITLLAFLIWKNTRFWGILGLVIIGLAIIVAPIIFSTTITRFLGVSGDTILGGRELLWPAGWQLIKDNLLIGVGIGNSPFNIVPYLGNSRSVDLSLLSVSRTSMHNPIFVLWAETGLPGLLLYLGVLIGAIYIFIRQYMKSRKIRNQNQSLYFALIASMFCGYMASWIKGGGMESSFSYFLILALLILPAYLNFEQAEDK